MARIRQLKPEFWTDDKIAGLSRDSRLLFLGLLTEADDDGRLVDSPKLLAGSLFPFDDDVTTKKLTAWLEEIMRIGLVRRYVRGAASYLYVVNFKRHQKIAHPRRSSLPSPDDDTPNAGGTRADFTQPADETPAERAPDLGVKGSRGQGVKGVGVKGSSSSSVVNHHVGLRPVPDDDEISPISTTLALMADRRIAAAVAGGLVIENPGAYRRRTLKGLDLEFGDRVERLCAEGDTPEAVADALVPVPRTASAAYAEPLAGEFVETVDEEGRLLEAKWVAS